jgi:hypothetical protein
MVLRDRGTRPDIACHAHTVYLFHDDFLRIAIVFLMRVVAQICVGGGATDGYIRAQSLVGRFFCGEHYVMVG